MSQVPCSFTCRVLKPTRHTRETRGIRSPTAPKKREKGDVNTLLHEYKIEVWRSKTKKEVQSTFATHVLCPKFINGFIDIKHAVQQSAAVSPEVKRIRRIIYVEVTHRIWFWFCAQKMWMHLMHREKIRSSLSNQQPEYGAKHSRTQTHCLKQDHSMLLIRRLQKHWRMISSTPESISANVVLFTI